MHDMPGGANRFIEPEPYDQYAVAGRREEAVMSAAVSGRRLSGNMTFPVRTVERHLSSFCHVGKTDAGFSFIQSKGF